VRIVLLLGAFGAATLPAQRSLRERIGTLGRLGLDSAQIAWTAVQQLAPPEGRTTWSIVVPDDPGLLGQSIWYQGAVLHLPPSVPGIRLTNSGVLTVVP